MNRYVEKYVSIMDFLSEVLGENTEIALHDFSNLEKSIVKINNGHISGRSVGESATDFVVRTLNDIQKDDFKCNYFGISKEGKTLKCSSFYIKNDEKNIVGMLCINIQIDNYIEARKYLDSFFIFGMDINENIPKTNIFENFGYSVYEITEKIIDDILSKFKFDVNKLSYSDKELIIEKASQNGIFLIKGSVGIVADKLNMSEPTVYRYLNKIKGEKN